jgi:hypothetical protein
MKSTCVSTSQRIAFVTEPPPMGADFLDTVASGRRLGLPET